MATGAGRILDNDVDINAGYARTANHQDGFRNDVGNLYFLSHNHNRLNDEENWNTSADEFPDVHARAQNTASGGSNLFREYSRSPIAAHDYGVDVGDADDEEADREDGDEYMGELGEEAPFPTPGRDNDRSRPPAGSFRAQTVRGVTASRVPLPVHGNNRGGGRFVGGGGGHGARGPNLSDRGRGPGNVPRSRRGRGRDLVPRRNRVASTTAAAAPAACAAAPRPRRGRAAVNPPVAPHIAEPPPQDASPPHVAHPRRGRDAPPHAEHSQNEGPPHADNLEAHHAAADPLDDSPPLDAAPPHDTAPSPAVDTRGRRSRIPRADRVALDAGETERLAREHAGDVRARIQLAANGGPNRFRGSSRATADIDDRDAVDSDVAEGDGSDGDPCTGDGEVDTNVPLIGRCAVHDRERRLYLCGKSSTSAVYRSYINRVEVSGWK
jgi:hypothetical protein